MSILFETARNYYNSTVVESLFSCSGSYWKNNEFWIKNPLRPDDKIGSFSINEKGYYSDFADESCKGDLIKLVSESLNIDSVEAAKVIIKTGGGIVPEDDFKSQAPKKKENDESAKYPIPDNAETKDELAAELRSAYFTNRYGDPVKAYAYRNFKGKIIFYTVRFEKEGSKVVVPFYLTNNGKWKNKRPNLNKFPIYGCEKLRNSKNPVLIVEGEKCADQEIPGYDIVSFIGGSKAVDKTDWKVLEDRDVIVFPDIDKKKDDSGHTKRSEDQPGMSAALKIKQYVSQAKIVNIDKIKKVLKPKDGWDIADGIEAGLNIDKIIENAGYIYDIDVKLNAYHLHKQFLADRYGYGNLDQIDGIFFKYHEKKHYWEKIISDNIKPDVKSWLEKTGIVDIILESDKNLKTMIADINTYVQAHALDYINENPFKESATTPWLHHKDGAINFKHDGFDFHTRDEKEEHFFKNMYPLTCLKFGIDEDFYNNFDIKKDCPAFHYYLRDLIPDKIKGTDYAELERKKTIELYSQILAYSLSPIKKMEHFFGFVGKEGTGKTFFIDVLRSLVGEQFTVETSISNVEKDKFSSSSLMNAKLFVEPDMNSNVMIPDGWIKRHAGNKAITIENKFENPIKGVKISIAMFIVSNSELKVPNVSGINRRLILLRYDNVLKNVDVNLFDKITGILPHGKESGEFSGQTFDERQGIFALALKGWESLAKNNHRFTLPDWVKNEKEMWAKDANTVSLFMDDEILEHMDFHFEMCQGKELFNRYQNWCKDESISHPYGRKRFYEEIRNMNNVIENRNGGQVNFKILKDSPENLKEINKVKDEIPF
jgi:hypothetical protein